MIFEINKLIRINDNALLPAAISSFVDTLELYSMAEGAIVVLYFSGWVSQFTCEANARGNAHDSVHEFHVYNC